ncbi:hypothetical protein, partial [Nonomuraea cavernae]|uniref:hypothetical protein n=1 Tax=Nonomuraea cavernae TaxID=2045107 RepID=UPI001E39F5F3
MQDELLTIGRFARLCRLSVKRRPPSPSFSFSVIWRGTPGVYAREETTAREGRQGPSGAVTGRP